ncbi:PLD nuclease N-terminal domain-containing protein [Aeromicrobium sp. Root472D3]|uniref:PLD nuclease N-terminal domain-containing protein n=1 Tax=Aeromicrobium sp. Root472D3 TaxID=1736540 RepID=UPI0009E70DD7|nr:PLD nuclease N-terminal domain-containing protein [Aeromicrobium sp. Root472D3]
MGKALLVVVAVVLVVYAIFDLLATPKGQVRVLPKIVWFVLVLVPFVGPLLWIFVGHGRQAPPPRQRGAGDGNGGGWTPPPSPRGPDDDPDYLRGL